MKRISNKKRITSWIFFGILSLAFTVFLPVALAQLPPPPPPPPLTPPVPQGLTGSRVSATTATLQWSAVSDGWLSGYKIYRCSGVQGCNPVDLVGTVNSTTTSFSDNTLTQGVGYGYAVTAYSGFGESDKSVSQSISPWQQQGFGLADFTALVAQWLQTGTGLSADVNTDNVVNTRDLGIMMSFWSGA